MMFSSGGFLSWIPLIFLFTLCLGIYGAIYGNDLYTIRSGIQIPLIWYIADWFTRTKITCIQVTLPPYLKLRDVVNNIFRVPL